jgi:predicted amidophosphoribosyltransferase
LAKGVARQRHTTYNRALVRLTQSRQVGASRAKRLQQLQSAFYIPRPDRLKGKNILLVDDIVTTGATLEAAARTIKQAGAASVSAVAFASKQ